MKNYKDLISVACIDAIHWWVTKESDFHKLFREGNVVYAKDKGNYETQFIKFTNAYSVFKFIEKGSRLKVLNNLMASNFHKEVKLGNINCLDTYLDLTKTMKRNNQQRHLSMLSKYATLINPETFTMLDRNTIDSLYRLGQMEGWGLQKHNIAQNYTIFLEAFHLAQSLLREKSHLETIDSHYKYLVEHFSTKTINRTIFTNRVVDKFLWYLHNQKY